jgi:PAS domain S-box-containing protein
MNATATALLVLLVAATGSFAGWQWWLRRKQLRDIARAAAKLAMDPRSPLALREDRELADVVANLAMLGRLLHREPRPSVSSSSFELVQDDARALTSASPMTRSGLFASPDESAVGGLDASSSGTYAATDMILRLHHETLRILDASPPLQEFLGWPLPALRTMSFLDMVRGEHRDLAREQLQASLLKGEALGLIYRVRTAGGATKAVEMNVSARYGPNMQATHLRCHLADITAKLQASRELRRRTRELTEANERLRATNRELAALEAQLEEKNADLAQANAELSRKNRELDEFGHVVSHDLQEPLRTLIAFSDFLLTDCGDKLDVRGRQHVGHLVDAARRMRAQIHDLLALSRAGAVTGDFRAIDLNALAGAVVSDLGELIRARAAEVVIREPLPTVWGDRTRMGQLLGNLIANGLKYNRSATPRVEVGWRPSEDPEWVTLFVRDNGIGVDPQYHEVIFQLFRRLHTREEFEGTGAGLAICRKIAQAHGGRIWVEGRVGEGSTFLVMFPARRETRA